MRVKINSLENKQARTNTMVTIVLFELIESCLYIYSRLLA